MCIFESCYDESKSIIVCSPAVSVVSQGHEVGSGDDEPVTAHTQRLRVTRDVGLQREELGDINILSIYATFHSVVSTLIIK